MKYIIIEVAEMKKVVIFDDVFVHKDVYEQLVESHWPEKERSANFKVSLYSAGEVNFDGDKFHAFGHSSTLQCGTRPDASDIINRVILYGLSF